MKSGKDENKDDFIHEYLLEMKKCEDDEDPIAYRGSMFEQNRIFYFSFNIVLISVLLQRIILNYY